MKTRFLLGPAGSGKTYRCLSEIREALRQSPIGPSLIFLAPKQATFQLERQLLADPDLPGYSRLQILSFERLAHAVLRDLQAAPRNWLHEEGRLMVLRALLSQNADKLRVFRSTARRPGLAQPVSLLLREVQHAGLTPRELRGLAQRKQLGAELSGKLEDLALMLESYARWLKENDLDDAQSLLEIAAQALTDPGPRPFVLPSVQGELPFETAPKPTPLFQEVWLDGFAEMTARELEFLAAVVSRSEQATLAFCLERVPEEDPGWLSTWSFVGQTFRRCYQRLAAVTGNQLEVEVLQRSETRSRFAGQPVFQHLEAAWSNPRPFAPADGSVSTASREELNRAIRVVTCAHPEAEARVAAREILAHVQAGGRFRDTAVILRSWEGYAEALRRVFTRYDIPFFLDRREGIAHHPLAELTRFALRTVAYGWRQEDWFGLLKTELVHIRQSDVDWLENEALARGWEGADWLQPFQFKPEERGGRLLEKLRRRLVKPFIRLAARLEGRMENDSSVEVSSAAAEGNRTRRPSGGGLAAALRHLWNDLGVDRQLQRWGVAEEEEFFPVPPTVHRTVWEQMHEWLDNLDRAFSEERKPLGDWLPILEAGLSGLTVGLVPPGLDQVVVGTIDRSRNPEVALALVLGVNEGVFPAPPHPGLVLTDEERRQLEEENVWLGPSLHSRLGQERYLGYIACTRARQRLVLTDAAADARDRKLKPSYFLLHLKRLFPDLDITETAAQTSWEDCRHLHEFLPFYLEWRGESASGQSDFASATAAPAEPDKAAIGAPALRDLEGWSVLSQFLRGHRHWFRPASPDDCLSAEMTERLFGTRLVTPVTRLEQFAECRFKFFVHSALRAKERLRFELDSRKLGDFQHQVLRRFHEEVRAEQKQWRDIPPVEGRARIRRLAEAVAAEFGNGVFLSTERERFQLGILTQALERFMETVLGWMTQYEFDPVAVELRFGEKGQLAPWTLALDGGRELVFTGVIDRVDLLRLPGESRAYGVVVDYKSSARKLDPRLLANGVQMQLPGYLSVLRHLESAEDVFGVERIVPAGVFYANLRGHFEAAEHRADVFENQEEAEKLAYRHAGRFNTEILRYLDNRDVQAGDQFNYRRKKNGELSKQCKEPMEEQDFLAMLDQAEAQLRDLGEAIFRGETQVNPYRQGQFTPCSYCDYASICRIDRWTHHFRPLKDPKKKERTK